MPVFLEETLARGFYHTFCLEVVWPLLHHCDIDPVTVNGGLHEAFNAYSIANQHYLEVVSAL